MDEEKQDQVKSLFNLPKEEKITDNFSCSIVDPAPFKGNLYLSTSNICFYSKFFAFEKKYKIKPNKVCSLKINEQNLEIEALDENKENKKYVFNDFDKDQLNVVYDKITKLKEEKDKTQNENENEDKDEESNDEKKEQPQQTANNNEPNKNIFGFFSGGIFGGGNKSDSDDEEEEEEDKKETKAKEPTEEQKQQKEMEKEKQEEQKLLNTVVSSEKTLTSTLIPNSNKIEFIPLDEDNEEFEVCQKIINSSPEQLFSKYLQNVTSDYSYLKFSEWLGTRFNINIPEWEKSSKEEGKFYHKKTFSQKLSGVPLVSESQVEKEETYWKEKDGTFYIKGHSMSKGVPFCDSFSIEDVIEFHPYKKGTKTVFRARAYANIIKSNFFSGIIKNQTNSNYHEEINKWLEFIKEKGEIIEGDYSEQVEEEEEVVGGEEKKNGEEKKDTKKEEKEKKEEKIGRVERVGSEVNSLGWIDLRNYLIIGLLVLVCLLLVRVINNQMTMNKLLRKKMDNIEKIFMLTLEKLAEKK